jgi:hypothetical protein
MKIKNLFFILLSSLALFGCSDARFESIPGQYLDLIPSDLQGNFRFYSKDIHNHRFDSLLVQINNNQITLTNKQETVNKMIHLDFQMHQMHDLFLIGINDMTFPTLWNLIVLEPTKEGMKVYFVNENKFKKEDPSNIQKFMGFRDLNYQSEPIQPNGNSDGGATPPLASAHAGPSVAQYYTGTEEQFRAYFDSELKNKDYIVLTRERGSKKSRK